MTKQSKNYVLIKLSYNWADEMDLENFSIHEIDGEFDLEKWKIKTLLEYIDSYIDEVPEEDFENTFKNISDVFDAYGNDMEKYVGTNESVPVKDILSDVSFVFITKEQYKEFSESRMFDTYTVLC